MENTMTTCLHDKHVALGAKMAPFAGFDMPIEYAGIEQEHLAVRHSCGMFDVSHMGEIFVKGDDATKFVNRIFTGDVTTLAIGQVVYGMMTNPQGGVVDDLLIYRFEQGYLLVINAANIDKDYAWVVKCAADEKVNVDINHLSAIVDEIAVQGPKAEEILQPLADADLAAIPFYHFTVCNVMGRKCLVSRTGYTGEDGFEVYADSETICQLWDKLIEAGVAPCGLGCRDTLRFEAGLPLYGHELADDITPIEAGLSMFVKLDKPDGFIGSEPLKAQKAEGPKRRSVGLEIQDRAIARAGSEVLDADGNVIGTVTTGYRGVSVPKSIAVALVDAAHAARGTELKVQVRRKTFPAIVVPRKFQPTNYKK